MSASQSRWSRVLVATGVVYLVVWQAATLVGLGRRLPVTLGVYGFVLHVVFGKAYALVPSYFDRQLAWSTAPAVHAPLTGIGTLALAGGSVTAVAGIEAAGAVAWSAGVAVFVVTLLATIRTNPTGAETGTGEHNADRRPVDRAANLFVPVVLAYLVVGTWVTLGAQTPLPVVIDGYSPRASHLLAAGTAALLVFAVGFRLLPRFHVGSVPRALPWVVLSAGAIGPALVAVGIPGGPMLVAGAALQAVAMCGFAVAYGLLFVRTERERVGFYGPLVGVVAGVVAVALGIYFALGSIPAGLVTAHYRLNLLGFLGLTIVGVSYQFYPPTVGQFPGAGDRLALVTLAALTLALAVEVAGALVAGRTAFGGTLRTSGHAIALIGALGYAYLVLGVFVQRARS